MLMSVYTYTCACCAMMHSMNRPATDQAARDLILVVSFDYQVLSGLTAPESEGLVCPSTFSRPAKSACRLRCQAFCLPLTQRC